MSGASIIAVLVGAIGAIVGVYFRESVRRANQQKLIAIKLSAYLLDWNRSLDENPLLSLFMWGIEWHKEEIESYKQKGLVGVNEVMTKHKRLLADIKNEIAKGNPELIRHLEKSHKDTRAMNNEQFSFSIENLDLTRKNLYNNYCFITDDEASNMSSNCANHVVQIKSAMSSCIYYTKSFTLTLRYSEKLDIIQLSGDVYKLMKSIIDLARHYVPLLNEANHIKNKNLIALTFRNMIN